MKKKLLRIFSLIFILAFFTPVFSLPVAVMAASESASGFIDPYTAYHIKVTAENDGYMDIVEAFRENPPEAIILKPTHIYRGGNAIPLMDMGEYTLIKGKKTSIALKAHDDSFNGSQISDIICNLSIDYTQKEYDRSSTKPYYSVNDSSGKTFGFFVQHQTEWAIDYKETDRFNKDKVNKYDSIGFSQGISTLKSPAGKNILQTSCTLRDNEGKVLFDIYFEIMGIKLKAGKTDIILNSDADQTAGETEVSIPIMIAVSIAGVFVAIGAAAATSGSSSGTTSDEGKGEKSRSTYKMYIKKDFGDKIRYNTPAMTVYARMAEVKADGTEIDRPDLSTQIEIFSGGGLNVSGQTFTGNYMGALVSAEGAKGVTKALEGIVSFKFTSENGSFQNNVTFKLIEEPYIKLESKYPDKVFILAGSGKKYEYPITFIDFMSTPKVIIGSISKNVLFEAAIETRADGSNILVIIDHSEKKTHIDKFFETFNIELIAENETERANTFISVSICYEGLVADFYKNQREIKGYIDRETLKMTKTIVDFKLGIWDDQAQNLAYPLPDELSFTYQDEQRLSDIIGLEAEKDEEQPFDDSLRYYLAAKISFPASASIKGEFTAMCKLGEQFYEYYTEIPLVPDIEQYQDSVDTEKELQNCIYMIRNYLPEDKVWEMVREIKLVGKKYNYGASDYRIYRQFVWNQAQDHIMKKKQNYMRDAALYDDCIKICEWAQYFGDIAFDILLMPVGGPLASFLITNAKNLMITAAQIYIEKGHIDIADVIKYLNNLMGGLDGVFSTTPSPTQYKKLAIWLCSYLTYRFIYNFAYGENADGTKMSWYDAAMQAFKDMGVKAVVAGFIGRYIESSPDVTILETQGGKRIVSYHKYSDDKTMKPLTDVGDSVIDVIDNITDNILYFLGTVKNGQIES